MNNQANRGDFDTTMSVMFSNPKFSKNYLFYAHMISMCTLKFDSELPAPAGVAFNVDHYDLYINPEVFDEYPVEQRIGILKHEMLHILNNHVLRQEERVHLPWNYGTDCAINQLIDYDHLPKDGVFPHNFNKVLGDESIVVPEKESSEFYYDMIKEQSQSQDQENGDGEGQDGDEEQDGGSGGTPSEGNGNGKPRLIDSHETWEKSQGDKDYQKDVTARMMKKAHDEAVKGRGDVPSQYSDWLDLNSFKSEVDWKKVLRNITGNKRVGKRSSIMRTDRRFPKRDDLRGHLKERTFNILVVADVSGSMSDKAVLHTLSEVKHTCDLTRSSADLIQIDTVAYEPQKIDKNTKVIERKARGGTTLSPALDKANEYKLDYQAVVVLTDGGLCDSDVNAFAKLRKKVIWLIEPQGHILDSMNNKLMKAIKLTEQEIGK